MNIKDITELQAWGPSRSLDLRGLQFGTEQRSYSPHSGQRRVTGEYALHFQCAWCLTSMKHQLGNSTMAPDDADDLFQKMFGGASPPLVVAVQHQAIGRLRLDFNSGVALEVLPDAAILDAEARRLFRPGKGDPHLVCYGTHLVTE